MRLLINLPQLFRNSVMFVREKRTCIVFPPAIVNGQQMKCVFRNILLIKHINFIYEKMLVRIVIPVMIDCKQ